MGTSSFKSQYAIGAGGGAALNIDLVAGRPASAPLAEKSGAQPRMTVLTAA